MHARFALTFGRGDRRHPLLSRAADQGLTCAIDRHDLLFLCDHQTEWLSCEGALLVGRLFAGTRRVTELSPEIMAELEKPMGAVSPRGHWGNFLLFGSSILCRAAYRDPSGAIPLYHCGEGQEAVFVSHAELALGLGLLDRFTLDTTFIRHWLQFPFLRTARTGIAEVAELIPGTRLSFSKDRRWRLNNVWHPAPFVARRAAIIDPREAAFRLREVAQDVVPLQVRGDRILLQLSGGLDSSIICCAIAGAHQEFPCVNFATASPDGDERSFAKDVASRFGLQLHELIEVGTAELKAPATPAFRPGTNPLLLPFEEAITLAARDLGAEVLIDGAGGDNLFCHLTSAAPVLDALAWAGPAQAWRTSRDISLRANTSWLEVLTAASKRLVKRRGWQQKRMFLASDALLDKPDPHPWLEGLGTTPPGKRQHVEALVHIQHFLDRRGSAISLAHPLLAQPLLELCLRIPSWLWMQGGRDRAVARLAFADLLPPSVHSRRTKGSLQGLFYRSFGKLRSQILELLMSGELRARRIIDADAIGVTLDGENPVSDDAQLRISEMVALEIWLQSWTSVSRSSSTRS